jgi:hypothetical protein
MKTISKLLLATAVAVGMTTATASFAGEPIHSPHGLANLVKHVPGTDSDANLVSGWYAGATVKQGAMFHSAVDSKGIKDVNLAARGNAPLYTGKDPARDLRPQEFQIAPLK